MIARRAAADWRLTAAGALLVAALLMPPLPWPRSNYDFLAVFDISQSMGVTDYRQQGRPVARLDYARRALAAALTELPCGSRLGLAAFTGYRSLMLLAPVEVCEHYGDLLATLAQIDERMRWAEASEITKGLYWALRAARDIGGEPELLFFTDGHESPPLDGPPPALFGDLRKGQIHGLVIGTGGNLPRPIPKRDSAGRDRGFWLPDEVAQGRGPDRRNEHLSARREPHLQALAFRTGLDYLRLEDFHGLSAAMQAAPRVRRREVPTDLSWVPLALALALLCAAPLGALIGNRGVRGSHRPHP
ncbi:MAG: VWA domain-containing protein [Rhodocyclaceae bacterium]|nr:VWA domain-containing protein [Rhodocyclaceae bacterium]